MFQSFPKPVRIKKKKRHYIRPGKKTAEWEAAKDLLEPAFMAVGITYCEVGAYLIEFDEYRERMERHRHNFFITWAHGDKRDNLVGEELLHLVVTSCVDCHNFIEKMPREKMRAIVEAIIKRRPMQPKSMFQKLDPGI